MPRGLSEARKSWQLLHDYEPYRQLWLLEAEKDMDYFFNRQWTEEEAETLGKRGQAPLVVNRITPVCLQKLASLNQHRPVIRAVPAGGPTDSSKASVASTVIQYILQRNEFPLVDLSVKRNSINVGLGYYYVYVDAMADDGRGEVAIKSLPYNMVWVDPNSREPDFSDAAHIIVSQEVTVEQAILRFPDKKRTIMRAANAGSIAVSDDVSQDSHDEDGTIRPADVSFSDSQSVGTVRLIERYTKMALRYWIVTNALGEFFYDVVDDATWQARYAKDKTKRGTPIWRRRIFKVISAGEAGELAREVLEIDTYPVIPAVNIHTGTPFPMGEIRYLRGMQDELNKRRSLMILNMALSSSNKWLFEKGSIDEDLWDRTSAIPNAKLPYRPGFEKPTPVMPLPLPAALVHLEAEAKYDIEYASGVFAMNQGSSAEAPDTYHATLALEEYSNRRLGPQLEIFGHAKRLVGKVSLQLAQRLYTGPKFMRILGEDGNWQELMINEMVTDSQTGTQYVSNALDLADYDVIIQSGMQAPTNQIARELRYQDLFIAGAIDNQALLEVIDMPNREKLIERLSTINQMRQANEALMQQNKDLDGLVQSLRRQAIQMGIKMAINEIRVLEKSNLLDTETRLRLLTEIEALRVKEHDLEMEYIERNAALTAKAAAMQKSADRTSPKASR